MKLSEAMRLGAMSTRQIRYKLGWRDIKGELLGTCAIGAVLDAHGVLNKSEVWPNPRAWLIQQYPILCEYPSQPPVAQAYADLMKSRSQRINLLNIIMHLNDTVKWTREQIADYVEGYEQQVSERDLVQESYDELVCGEVVCGEVEV